MNIDRIAREMVDVEPSVDLEAKIRARLKEVRPTGRSAWWNWRIAVPLTAAAALALIIGVQVSRSPGVVTPGAVQVSRSLPAEAAPAGAVAQAGSRVPQLTSSKVTTSRLPKVPTAVPSAEELAWMDRRIPALDPVNSLQMDRLRVDSIQPEPLAITPLTMTPVATESGGIERRNDR